jgi:hypothetical protein
LTRRAEVLEEVLLRQLQADTAAVVLVDALALRQQHRLGESRGERAGV